MCHPAVIAATTVMSTVATGVKTIQQNRAADANMKSAQRAAAIDYQALVSQGRQRNEAAAQKTLQRQLQTERARSRIRAVQAGAGVSSSRSALYALNNMLTQESMDVGVIETNRQGYAEQARNEQASIRAREESRLNRAGASKTGSGLMTLNMMNSAVSGAASGYNLYSSGNDFLNNLKI